MAKVLCLSQDYLSLAKPRIVALLVLVAVVTAMVAGGGALPFSRVALLALAGTLSCSGSSLLNNYLDRDMDGVMERTKNRPLPRGRAEPTTVLLIGLALLALSLVIALSLNYLTALFVLCGALIYVGLYTMWLKRRSSFNIVIGGLAGSCAVLAGWFAINAELTLTPVLIALLLFLWTPSHFWSFALAHQESYKSANIPMLPTCAGEKRAADYILLHSGALLAISPLLYISGSLDRVYLFGSILLSGLFLAFSIWLWKKPRRERAWINYRLSGIYLLGLFILMLLDVLV